MWYCSKGPCNLQRTWDLRPLQKVLVLGWSLLHFWPWRWRLALNNHPKWVLARGKRHCALEQNLDYPVGNSNVRLCNTCILADRIGIQFHPCAWTLPIGTLKSKRNNSRRHIAHNFCNILVSQESWQLHLACCIWFGLVCTWYHNIWKQALHRHWSRCKI